MATTIDGPDEFGEWSLRVDGDDVLALRAVPYDGVLYHSTEDRPNRADKNSEFQLGVREVVRRYVAQSETDAAVGDLVDRVQVALADEEADH